MTNKKKKRKSTRRPRKYEKLKSAVKYQLLNNIKKKQRNYILEGQEKMKSAVEYQTY